jgi:hypothetical protein
MVLFSGMFFYPVHERYGRSLQKDRSGVLPDLSLTVSETKGNVPSVSYMPDSLR